MSDHSFNPTNITTNATTAVKASPGVLHTITINTKGATGNTIKVYNDPATSNNLIATIDGTLAGPTYLFDCFMSNGITVITASGTCADITVNYL